MHIEDNNGASVQHRPTEYVPPKSWQTWLIGRPLQTADAPHQTIGKLIGLAVFASDALSSTAYATQEMLAILILAGMSAIGFAFPIAIGIVFLLAILTISYVQTINAYPHGGGAYVVARDNLGKLPSLVAGAALLTDYILTVSVSISSGVAQIVSAVPELFEWRVWIGVAMVMLVMVVNLRGVKESGMVFAIPSYIFVIMMYVTVGLGMLRLMTGSLGQVIEPPEMEMLHTAQAVSFFLILRAFSSGTSALTGVEAISNGVTAFKEPRSRNASITLVWMSLILGSLLLGITYLATHIHAVPSEAETVISQLARTVYDGRGAIYIVMITTTSIILFMAANTAFAGFPRLSALTAEDGLLPRQLAFRGSRLVYSSGIIALAVIASLLIVFFQASVSGLIPLYAIGVFLSFSLAQAGLTRRWWKSGKLKEGEKLVERGSTLHREKYWLWKMLINGGGAIITLIVTCIFAITKFLDGAWIVMLVIPGLVIMFSSIHRHYQRVAVKLSLDHYGAPSPIIRHRVILTMGGVHRGSLAALRYARSLSDDITAVHVSIDPEQAEKIQKKWEIWGDGIRLAILESPYRLFIEPLLEYIEELAAQLKPNEIITVVVPQFISKELWTGGLHSRTADTLRKVLLNRKNVVITEVPYIIESHDNKRKEK